MPLSSSHPVPEVLAPLEGASTPPLWQQASQNAALDRAQADDMALWGKGEVWSRTEVSHRIRTHIATAATEYWEVCRLIAWGHAALPRPEWMTWLENEVGMAQCQAYKCLTIAHRMGTGGTQTQLLLSKGITKVFDLVSSLDDEEIQNLMEGDAVAGGITLDSLDQMSTRELKRALRQAKQKEEQGNDKHNKIVEENRTLKMQVGELVHGVRRQSQDHFHKRLDKVTGELALAHTIALRLFEDIDWSAAAPELRVKWAALVETERVFYGEMASLSLVSGVRPVPQILDAQGNVHRLSVEADMLLGHCQITRDMANGELLDVAKLRLAGVGMEPPSLAAAVAELVREGFLIPTSERGVYAFNGELPSYPAPGAGV